MRSSCRCRHTQVLSYLACRIVVCTWQGVAFTRDPSTGENYFYGEFLMNAQGEDVVVRARQPITTARRAEAALRAVPGVGGVGAPRRRT